MTGPFAARALIMSSDISARIYGLQMARQEECEANDAGGGALLT